MGSCREELAGHQEGMASQGTVMREGEERPKGEG